MLFFLIERNFAQELVHDGVAVAEIQQINDEIGIQWLYSILSADKRKTYCLYEAPSAEAIRVAARRLNIPADGIIPVSEVRPELIAAPDPSDPCCKISVRPQLNARQPLRSECHLRQTTRGTSSGAAPSPRRIGGKQCSSEYYAAESLWGRFCGPIRSAEHSLVRPAAARTASGAGSYKESRSVGAA